MVTDGEMGVGSGVKVAVGDGFGEGAAVAGPLGVVAVAIVVASGAPLAREHPAASSRIDRRESAQRRCGFKFK